MLWNDILKEKNSMSNQWYYQTQTIGNSEAIGPLTNDQFATVILAGKIKKKDYVSSPQATQNKWVMAADVPFVKSVLERRKNEAMHRKPEAAERPKAQTRKRTERSAEATDKIESKVVAHRDRLFGAKESPEQFVATCNSFIQGIRIIGWLAIGIAIFIQIAIAIAMILAVSAARDDVESLVAVRPSGLATFFAIVIQMVLGYIFIEASVLFLRFMKTVVVLLNQPVARE